MTPFEFTTVGRIIFGRGQFKRVGELAAELGRKALVVTNADRTGKLGLLNKLATLLQTHGVSQTLFRIQGEPQTEDVDRGVAAAQSAGCDCLIALGGGSALDAAKAISGLLTNGGVALDYMEVVGKGQKITRPGMPWLAIPTTSGTGAEATRNAVIGCAEKHFKASIRSHHLLPRVALVDAELTLHVRPEVTARSGMDALTQLIEAYTAKGAQPLTDALARQGLRHAARSLRQAFHHGDDLAAREDMALAALLSGICLNGAGLGAVHGFASPLGASFPVPHGTVCAALLPHVLSENIAVLSEPRASASGPDRSLTVAARNGTQNSLARYAEIGRILANNPALPDVAARRACVESAKNLVAELAIPRLSQFGMTEKDIPAQVALAQKSNGIRQNPVPLPEDALARILRQTL